MVKVKEDLTGKVFGRLTVVKQAEDHVSPNGEHIAMWQCKCGCGNPNDIIVAGSNLRRENGTRSCGCLVKELLKKYNKYDLSGEYGVGWTTNTDKEFYFELEDYDKIKNICWYEHHSNSNFSTLIGYDDVTNSKVKMHIYLGYKNYDHIDRNELNNLRSNLRPATHQENQQNRSKAINNTSGFIGVTWSKQRQKWIAQLSTDGVCYNLGGYININDAVRARLRAEKEYFGTFAPQIHLFKEYDII